MKKANNNNWIALGFALALFALPVAANAQNITQTGAGATSTSGQFSQNGIFSCQGGQYAQSVGSQTATASTYVPVSDATVELNTGILVYEECILREVLDAERIAATTGIANKAYVQVQTGRNGSPEYSTNIVQDTVTADNQIITDDLNGTLLDPLDPPTIEQAVKQAIAQAYVAQTQNRGSQLTCPYQGSTADYTSGTPSAGIFTDILGVASPCNPLIAYDNAYDMVSSDQGLGNGVQFEERLEGNGFYPVTTGGNNPLTQTITTPGSLVEQPFAQIVETGFTQLQNANDLGQMVGALFAGLSTQIMSTTGNGLAGLSQSIGSQPSYLNQVASESTNGLQGAVQNDALSILDASLQVEQNYYDAVTGIASTLEQTAANLRGEESQCWNLIIQNVCTSTSTPEAGHNTCTDAQGNTIKIATSTVFSQALINAQILPLASTTATNITASQNALSLLSQLIQGVTDTGSQDAQQIALAQLDQLVAQHALHTQQDLSSVESQSTSVTQSMTTLVQNAAQTWGDGTPDTSNPYDPNSGWCNVTDPTVVQMWDQLWRQ